MENVKCAEISCADCCRKKHTPRDEKSLKCLNDRLNRIIGQLNGIKNMLNDNRYCGDVLMQLSAAERVSLFCRSRVMTTSSREDTSTPYR